MHCTPIFLIATVETKLKMTVSTLHSHFSFSYSRSLTKVDSKCSALTFLISTVEAELRVTYCTSTFLIAIVEAELMVSVSAMNSYFSHSLSCGLS